MASRWPMMWRKGRRWAAWTGLTVLLLLALGLGTVLIALRWHPPLDDYAQLDEQSVAPPPDALQVRFFGVTSLLITDGSNALITDAFFSRPSPFQLAFTALAPDPRRIDAALRRGGLEGPDALDAVLVTHTHVDHALDAAVVAERTGALLVGSASAAQIGHGHGLVPERILTVRDRDVLTFGRFTVEVFVSPHAPDPLFRGEITAPLRPPARSSAYQMGTNHTYLIHHTGPDGTTVRILVHASANVEPGQYRGVQADIVFLSVATLGRQPPAFAHTYWHEVVRTTGASLVVPIHWDDFLRPLDQPLRPWPPLLDDFAGAMRRLQAEADADDIPVRFMPAFTPFRIEDLPRRGSGGATVPIRDL